MFYIKNKVPPTRQVKIIPGFYEDNIESYEFVNELDEGSVPDIGFVKYRRALSQYTIRRLGTAEERLIVCEGDIGDIRCDAVVNAANPSLLGGGGVDGAIHRAAGPQLYEACRALGGCEHGKAVITDAFEMPVKKIIHAVGPIYEDGNHGEEQLLIDTYRSALDLAVSNGLDSIAMPAISCGIYGYPAEEGAEIMIQIALEYLERYPQMRLIYVVNHNMLRIMRGFFW